MDMIINSNLKMLSTRIFKSSSKISARLQRQLNLALSSVASSANDTSNVSPRDIYRELADKREKKLKIALKDLKHLLIKSVEIQKGGAVAQQAVHLYQRAGHDFSEEICTLFVRVCAPNNSIKPAASMLIRQDYRIGSWLNKNSLSLAVSSLVSKGELELALKVIHQSIKRGLSISQIDRLDELLIAAKAKPDQDTLVAEIETVKNSIVAK